jgi:EAL domain-containing protein (putative c-di-GMP-specific phosphodiesterase class I)
LCSINLSGQSLGDDELLTFILQRFSETGIPPHKICFEITETAAISKLSSASQWIQSLRQRGCRFALDDFGSGLSSFGYLKTLPVDYLKIDGQFIKDIIGNPMNMAIVRSIHEIARVMGTSTIAEFVESDAILEKLREIGIDYAQGYGISRPQPFEYMINSYHVQRKAI